MGYGLANAYPLRGGNVQSLLSKLQELQTWDLLMVPTAGVTQAGTGISSWKSPSGPSEP